MRMGTLTQPPLIHVSEVFMTLQSYGRVMAGPRNTEFTSAKCNRTHSEKHDKSLLGGVQTWKLKVSFELLPSSFETLTLDDMQRKST
jgi:hypothetical protein